jgi:hypothetical protein
MLGGLLLSNAASTIDQTTLYRTFFAAAAIMFLAFLIALYSVRSIGNRVAVN